MSAKLTEDQHLILQYLAQRTNPYRRKVKYAGAHDVSELMQLQKLGLVGLLESGRRNVWGITDAGRKALRTNPTASAADATEGE